MYSALPPLRPARARAGIPAGWCEAIWVLACAGLLLAASPSYARSFLVDFNSSRGFRGADPVSPDLNGNHWNTFPHPGTGSSQLNGMVDSSGQASTLDFGAMTAFGSDSYNGPAGDTTGGAPAYALDPAKVSSTDIDAAALGDLGHLPAAFDYIATTPHTPPGQAASVEDARFAIQGLDPEITYTLRLFGSRKYATESTTIYEAFSDPAFEYLSASVSLEVQNPASPAEHNRNAVAELAGVRPSANGAIYLRVRAEGGNQGYLNSMQIIEGTRPVDNRGLLYVRLESPSTGREIVSDPDRGVLNRVDPPQTDLRGHWYLMTRTDNSLVWIVNRVTGEALRAAADAGPLSTAPWNPEDPRQTWRMTTTAGVSRLRIDGTDAALTAGPVGGAPSVSPTAAGNPDQDWILPELPRGGLFPWVTYDEDNIAALSAPGQVIRSPYTDGPIPLAAEAQKRGVVLLDGSGAHVSWTVVAPADAVNLRYSVADGTSGSITLRLSRAGSVVSERKVPVTSAQAWVYFDSQGNELQTPGTGRTPAKRFNEARIKLDQPLAAGDTLEFRRDSGDVMTWIDAVETENAIFVPLPDAADYLVSADFGTTGNGTADDTSALKNAVAAAAAQGKKLYLPAGTYRLEEEIILPPGLVLQGAGAWNTELVFSRTATSAYAGQGLGGLKGTGSNTAVRDLYLKSAQSARNLGYHALKGFWGTGSVIENVWTDQFETGAWIADFSNDGSIVTDGLVIRNCRLRNSFADGVNYASGTRNSVVENTHVRGCGDDGLATYAAGRSQNKPTTRNIQFRYNTIECVYRAGGIGIFGGEGHKIHHNVVRDQVAGPGLRLNTVFVYLNGALEGYPFGSQLIHFYDNTLERTGNLTVFNEQAGAIELQTWYTDVENIRFSDIDIDTTRYEGIRYSRIGQVSSAGFRNIVFTGLAFTNVPFGTLITSSASGESSFDTPTSAAGINNQAGANFTVNGPPPPPPEITSFSPAAAGRGSEVTVTGQNLGSVTLVQVGALTAVFTVVDDNTLRFTVPPQAMNGRIRVTTSFDTFAQTATELTVPENNESPSIALALPNAVSVPSGAGLRLAAAVTDDGLPAPPAALTSLWSVATAPSGASVTFDDASQLSTGATFSTVGNYLLRLTVTDGELQSTADVAVAYGGSAAGSGQDVGNVGRTGNSAAANGMWTVQASGADIWDTADGFHFRYAELRGDGFVQARLLGQTNTDPWAKAGVMIRDSLTAGSSHAMLVGTTGNGLALQNRPTTGALSQHQALGAYPYGVWLRLVRRGTAITAYRSSDGANWTQVGTAVSPVMADPVYVGLAVTSHNNGSLSTATFDQLQGNGFGIQAPAVSAGDDLTAALGQSALLSGSAGGSSTALWQQVSGPGILTFATPSVATTMVSASAAGLYRVRLVAATGATQTFDDALVQFVNTSKGPATIELSGLRRVYDGTPVAAAATTSPPDLPVIITYNGSTAPPVDAGTYEVVAAVSHGDYEGSATGALTILKAPAAVALQNPAAVVTYNGLPRTASAATTPSGLGVRITYDGSLNAPANAGTYAVAAVVDDINYEGRAAGSLEIRKAPATITLDNLAQTYTGTPRTVSVTTLPAGLIVRTTYDGSSTPPAGAGSYAVQTTVQDNNFEGAASGVLQVAKARAAINLSGLAATFDGTVKAPAVSTEPPGLAATITWSGSSSAPSQIGSYPFVASIADGNHEGAAGGTLTIAPATPAVRGIALVDFGPTPTTPVSGIYWNNFTNDSAGFSLPDLVTTNNTPTGYTLSMATANSMNTGWINSWDTGQSGGLGLFNVQTAATDGFFVAPAQGKRGVRLAGLATNRIYTLAIYGGRDAPEIRSTTYTVRGAATATGVLTNSGAGLGAGGANYNNNRALVFSDIAPDLTGAIHVEYQRAEGSYGYLNALSIEEKIPLPSGYAAWAGASGLPAPSGGDFWSVRPASGQADYFRFAFGSTAPDGSFPQKTEIYTTNGSDYLALTIPVRRGAVFAGSPPTSVSRDGVVYQVRGSADPGGETPVEAVEVTGVADGGLPAPADHDGDGQADYEYRRFRLAEPVGLGTQGFLRVNVWPSW